MPERPSGRCLPQNPPSGFPKSARLRASADFSRVIKQGKRRSAPCFSIHLLPVEPGRQPSGPRLGITVSRKVSPNAVVRNKIKRMIRESFRHHRHELPALDLVVVARSPAAGLDRAALRHAIDALWAAVPRP